MSEFRELASIQKLTDVESKQMEFVVRELVKAGFKISEMEFRSASDKPGYNELWCAGKCVCSSELVLQPDKPAIYRFMPYPAEPKLR